MEPQNTTLYSDHAGADKVYHVYLNQKGGGWTVDFAHAGRGKALKTGTKTATPISYEAALKKYLALIKEKMNGDSHYRKMDDSGSSYASTADAGTPFGIVPQQPTAITREQLQRYLEDDGYGIQEKANGENRLIRVCANDVHGGNKKGLKIAGIPSEWVTQFSAIGDFVANGEHVGERFLAFDLLELGGEDLRQLPQRERYARLVQMHDRVSHIAPAFGLLECHYTTAAKKALFSFIMATRREGVVAKKASAAYVEGRGVDTLKFKFNETSTCIVIARNQQRSVQIGLLDANGQVVSAGNVSIPINKAVPEPGDLVDVQYLYWTGCALEQSVYDPDDISPRTDIWREECVLTQITRHKPEHQDVDPAAHIQRLTQQLRTAPVVMRL